MKKNNCFDLSTLTEVGKAKRLMLKGIKSIKKVESIRLIDAVGRILAKNIVSNFNIPPYDNAAVDGYAFNLKDSLKKNKLKIIGTSKPGEPFLKNIKSGEGIKIFTGAPIIYSKKGLKINKILMEEECKIKDDYIILPGQIDEKSNIRPKGEDIKKDLVTIKKGRKIRSVDLGYFASMGLKHIPVYKKLRVGIFSSGNELSRKKQISKFQIFDSNKITLISLFTAIGCESIDLGTLGDNYDSVKKGLKSSTELCDIIVTTGGISSSETDKIIDVFKDFGKINFWRLAIKPGRPLAFGKLNNIPFFGLPGNPVAVIVCFFMLICEYINIVNGRIGYKLPYNQVSAGFSFTKKIGRTEWLRGSIKKIKKQTQLVKYEKQGSGILSSVFKSQGIIELESNIKIINKGEKLKFYNFEEMLK